MKKYLISFAATALLAACGGQVAAQSALEKSVIERAQAEPSTATEYFLEKFKPGMPVEDQAIYAYGMGVAAERQGNRQEAINNYLAAEGLGNQSAAKALDRLHVKRD